MPWPLVWKSTELKLNQLEEIAYKSQGDCNGMILSFFDPLLKSCDLAFHVGDLSYISIKN